MSRTSAPHAALVRRLDDERRACLKEAEVVALNARGRAMSTAEWFQFVEAVREAGTRHSAREELGGQLSAETA